MPEYRNLSSEEIETLSRIACSADNWNRVKVIPDFKPDFIENVSFSGDVRLGTFNKTFEMEGGFRKHSGLFDCCIHNCTIGNDVYIHKIHNYIANYEIGDGVYIENTNILVVDKSSNFGNGSYVTVMNETGGREIPIFNELTAPLAYIIAMYRHRPAMIEKLFKMIDAYSALQSSSMGQIGKESVIINCGKIKNVKIGEYARIKGASTLKNGTINSKKSAPVIIGSGVKASNFIFASGVQVLDSTLISNCFVGQGSFMDKHYSAHDSVFFSNCQGLHGEATSIFAGPFTVSYHKSTLLISGMFSFLNAGSGSNQSNHMYKLGPIHQGVVERGSKTTSDSYLLWPAKIGPFTLVMGRHTSHADTTNLPFSYLIENNSESILVPAVNIKSVGTIRDAQKWPRRDRRTDDELLDPINYNLLSPFTIHKMYQGMEILESLKQVSGETSKIYSYQNCKINNSSLNKGIELYKLAICKFLGNSLISKIEKVQAKTFSELQSSLAVKEKRGLGSWIDLAGLIAPKNEVNNILDRIENDEFDLHGVMKALHQLHQDYYDLEWHWAQEKLEKVTEKPLHQVSKEEMIDFIGQWESAVVKLDKLLYEDAKKEFDLASMTGFGMDGDEQEKQRDFENVRGSFEKNPFVREVLSHIERKSALAKKTINYLNELN